MTNWSDDLLSRGAYRSRRRAQNGERRTKGDKRCGAGAKQGRVLSAQAFVPRLLESVGPCPLPDKEHANDHGAMTNIEYAIEMAG